MIDIFVIKGKHSKIYFNADVKILKWEDPKSNKIFNCVSGDRELDIIYNTGDTTPVFLNVELTNSNKFKFLIVYTSNTNLENEFNLEDSKAINEVMIDQQDRRAAGIPNQNFFKKTENENISQQEILKSEKNDVVKSDKNLMQSKDEILKQKENIDSKEDEIPSMQESNSVKEIRSKKKLGNNSQNIKKSKDKNNKFLEKSENQKQRKSNLDHKKSFAVEILNYLNLQEEGDMAEIRLLEYIEINNGFKKEEYQLIKIPIEIREGKIFISLLNQLCLFYKGKEGLPINLNKNIIDASFIKK